MKDTPKLHCSFMETAIADLINPRVHTIVPNVSFGLGLRHEADMLVLDHKNRITEIEIKVSASDLRADFKKPHGHVSDKISRLVYAVPDKLKVLCYELVPKRCGIIIVIWNDSLMKFEAQWSRQCKHNKTPPVSDKIVRKLLELGCMRIWSLKKALHQRQIKYNQ